MTETNSRVSVIRHRDQSSRPEVARQKDDGEERLGEAEDSPSIWSAECKSTRPTRRHRSYLREGACISAPTVAAARFRPIQLGSSQIESCERFATCHALRSVRDWRLKTETHTLSESHPHTHEHGGRDDDEHTRGLGHLVRGLFAPHSHDAKDSLDQALEGSRDGVRAVAISLVILLLTAGVQALVVVVSGSVALLGDTFHNGADALTALPLWMAFSLGRRPAT